MDSKLQELVDRLEKVATRLENAKVLGGAGSGSDQKEESYDLSNINKAIDDWLVATKETNIPQLAEMAELAVGMLQLTNRIINASLSSKKPDTAMLPEIQKAMKENWTKIDNQFVRAKARDWEIYGQFLTDGLQVCFWVFQEIVIAAIDGVIESAEFKGNKIRMKKIPEQKKWVDSFMGILKAHKEFAKEHAATGLTWKGKDHAALQRALTGESGPSPTKETPKQEEQKKEAPKQDVKPVAPVKPKVISDKGPRGDPRKYSQFNVINFENYDNDKSLHVKAEEVSITIMVAVYNSINSAIKVDGKCKGITIANCKKMRLIFDKVISTVELMNCDSVDVYVLEGCPMINISKCSGVNLYLTKERETEVTFSNAGNINITSRKGEDDWEKEYSIPDQFVVTWDPKQEKYVQRQSEHASVG